MTVFLKWGAKLQRMVEAGRDLWNSPCPTVLLNWDHLKQVVQGHALTAFQYLRIWGIITEISDQRDSQRIKQTNKHAMSMCKE